MLSQFPRLAAAFLAVLVLAAPGAAFADRDRHDRHDRGRDHGRRDHGRWDRHDHGRDRDRSRFRINFYSGPAYRPIYRPAPVYYQPAPVIVRPAPVIYQQPVIVQPGYTPDYDGRGRFYRVGDTLVDYRPVPSNVLVGLPRAPYGHYYSMADDDVFVVSSGSNVITNIISVAFR